MNKTILTALLLSTAALGACTAPYSPTHKPPGTYKSSSSSTDASGTKTTVNKTTHVYEDSSGNKKAVVKTETSKDPEGLFNKETSTTTKTYN